MKDLATLKGTPAGARVNMKVYVFRKMNELQCKTGIPWCEGTLVRGATAVRCRIFGTWVAAIQQFQGLDIFGVKIDNASVVIDANSLVEVMDADKIKVEEKVKLLQF